MEMVGGLRPEDMVSKVVCWPEFPGLSWCNLTYSDKKEGTCGSDAGVVLRLQRALNQEP